MTKIAMTWGRRTNSFTSLWCCGKPVSSRCGLTAFPSVQNHWQFHREYPEANFTSDRSLPEPSGVSNTGGRLGDARRFGERLYYLYYCNCAAQ